MQICRSRSRRLIVNTAPLSDLGSAALEKASELTSTAAELVPDLPERVGRMARMARRRFRPAPRRSWWATSPWRPVLVVAAALAACLILVAWLRRTADDKRSERAPSEQSERATIAAVS
jgi:hypothetical protein